MSWTYSGDPSYSDLDLVRFLIGDTDTTAQQLTDEEILGAITIAGGVYPAAIMAVRQLASYYARRADKSVGDLSISYSQIAKNYRDLVGQLQTQAITLGGTAPPYAGGISVSDKQIDEGDSDRVAPAFTVGMHSFDKNRDNNR